MISSTGIQSRVFVSASRSVLYRGRISFFFSFFSSLLFSFLCFLLLFRAFDRAKSDFRCCVRISAEFQLSINSDLAIHSREKACVFQSQPQSSVRFAFGAESREYASTRARACFTAPDTNSSLSLASLRLAERYRKQSSFQRVLNLRQRLIVRAFSPKSVGKAGLERGLEQLVVVILPKLYGVCVCEPVDSGAVFSVCGWRRFSRQESQLSFKDKRYYLIYVVSIVWNRF